MGFVHAEDNLSVDNNPSVYEELHVNYISYTKYVMLVIYNNVAAVLCDKFTINGEQVCFVNDSKNVKADLFDFIGNSRIYFHIYSDKCKQHLRLSSIIRHGVYAGVDNPIRWHSSIQWLRKTFISSYRLMIIFAGGLPYNIQLYTCGICTI